MKEFFCLLMYIAVYGALITLGAPLIIFALDFWASVLEAL